MLEHQNDGILPLNVINLLTLHLVRKKTKYYRDQHLFLKKAVFTFGTF